MNVEFQIEVAVLTSMDSRDEPSVRLRVSDHTSSEVLVDVNLSAGQWLALQSGTSLKFDSTTSNHLERIGRKMHVRRVDIPRDSFTSYKRDEQEQQARSAALKCALLGETIEVRSTNSGWVAIYRSWS